MPPLHFASVSFALLSFRFSVIASSFAHVIYVTFVITVSLLAASMLLCAAAPAAPAPVPSSVITPPPLFSRGTLLMRHRREPPFKAAPFLRLRRRCAPVCRYGYGRVFAFAYGLVFCHICPIFHF